MQTCVQALSSLSCQSSEGKHGADVRAHAGAAVVHPAGGSHAGSVLGACGAPAPGAHWGRVGYPHCGTPNRQRCLQAPCPECVL